MFSAGLSARNDAIDGAAELDDIDAQLDEILATRGLGREHLVRMRCSVADARDLAAVAAWWEAWGDRRPPLVVWVGSQAHPDRRLSVDAIASSDPPDRVTAVDAGWHRYPADWTVSARAGGVAFTAAAAGGRGVGEATRQLSSAIAPFGLAIADVAKVEGVIDDWRLYPRFRDEYARAMPMPYPTRSLTQGDPRERDAHVQLAWIAVSGGRSRSTFLVPPDRVVVS
jgi:enamine deaminase RidA (YjgF/YER057c/UK114 family)